MIREKYDPAAFRENNEITEPKEIDCIITTKVYDACRQQECEFFQFGPFQIPQEWDIDHMSSYANVVPKSVSFKVSDISLINEGPLARVEIEVCAKIDAYIVNTQNGEEIQILGENGVDGEGETCFEKDVILYLPDPDKMDAIAEAIFSVAGKVTIEAIETTDTFNIFIPVGAFIIIKSVAEVQLLIPVFGFCPTPDPCEEFPDLDDCEEFQLLPFPDFYPPQRED